MTDSQSVKCHGIIHTATVAAAAVGAGLAQIPCADMIPITAAQVTMIISLGAVFDKPLDEAAAKAIWKGLKAAIGGRFIAQVLVGLIPLVGNYVKATTAAAITEKIGWAAAEKFDKEASKKVIPSSL